jgi:RNA polymerase sigma-70 factor (ECF subfamily)
VFAKPRWLRSDDDFGYLLRALRNTFLVSKRTEGRRPRTEPFPDDREPAGGVSPEAELEAREVYSAIAALQPDFRDVLVAVDVAGLSYGETARALRLADGTVMSRLYRARQQVARSLAPAAT